MYIAPVGMNTINNRPSFEGNVIKKGKFHYYIGKGLEKARKTPCEPLNKLLEGHNLVFRAKSKTLNHNSTYGYRGTTLYSVTVSRIPENSRFWKILDSLGFVRRYKFTENKYYPYDMANKFDEHHFSILLKNYTK